MYTRKKHYRYVALFVAFSMLLSLLQMEHGQAEASTQLKLQSEKVLAHGAKHKVYTKMINSRSVLFHVVEVDLTHQSIKVAPMFGKEIGSRERVTTMTTNAGAVAGINASFFNMQNEGGTLGTIVKDGEMISNPAKVSGWNTFAILANQQAMIQELGFSGQIIASNGNTFPLEGMNKTEYWSPGSPASNYSGTIHMFTRDWGEKSRGHIQGYSELIEVEVTDGLITDIRVNSSPTTIPENGYVLMAHGKGMQFLQQNFEIGDPIDVKYQLTPENLNINQAVGANHLLVQDGRVSTMPTDSALNGRNSRSALGITADGKKLFMLSVDRTDRNPGVTLTELADILIDLGSHRAVNLDGGGSTSLAVRNPGDLESTRVNATTFERSVADALGIFNVAPRSAAKELRVWGPEIALLNETSTFYFNGYDTNYQPYRANELNWSIKEETGNVNGQDVQWVKGGETYVQIEKDGVTARHPLTVIGPDQIANIQVSPADIVIFPGQKQNLSVQIILTNGQSYKLQSNQIQWNTNGMGQMEDFTFTGGEQLGKGTLDISVAGKTTKLPVEISYTFRDIQNHWAKNHIEFLAEKGYAKGLSVGEFAPSKDLTRAELIVFLSRVMDWQITDKESAVTLKEQVPAYAESAIKYAVHHGIIQGDHQGRIHASNPITRMEMATILERILSGQPNPPEMKQNVPMNQLYSDWNSVPAWAQEPVQYVSDRQIFGGADGQFKPKNNITRAEVVTVLVRSFFNEKYTD